MANLKYIGKNILNHDLTLKKGNVSGSSTSTGSFGSLTAVGDVNITADANNKYFINFKNHSGGAIGGFYNADSDGVFNVFDSSGATRVSLHSDNNSYFNKTGGNLGLGTNNPTSLPGFGGSTFHINGSDASIRLQNSTGTFEIGADSSNDLKVYRDASNIAMIIKNSGNVGIGVTNPGVALEVNGSVSGSATSTGSFGQLKLIQDNSPTNPTLNFGDGDSGFYESADDVIRIGIAGAFSYAIDSAGIQGNASNRFQIRLDTPTSTVPNFTPNKTDSNTGIGWSSADKLSLIAGGVSGAEITSAGVSGSSTSTGSFGKVEAGIFSGSFHGQIGARYLHEQSTASTTWTMIHNLGSKYPNVTVYDSNDEIIIPASITATTSNETTLTFPSAVAGVAQMGLGGGTTVSGRTFLFEQGTASTLWQVTHSLGEQYPAVTIYDADNRVLIPAEIQAIDLNHMEVTFQNATSGNGHFSVGNGLPGVNADNAGNFMRVSAGGTHIEYTNTNNNVTGSFLVTGSIEILGSGSVSGSSTSTGSFGELHIADKIGIGDTTPGYKLDVTGDGRFTTDLTVDNRIAINTSPDAFLSLATDSDGSNVIIALDHDGNALMRLRDSSAAALFNLYDGGVEKITLDADLNGGSITLEGNVSGSSTSTGSFGAGYIDNKLGIGETNPAEKLDVAGNIKIDNGGYIDTGANPYDILIGDNSTTTQYGNLSIKGALDGTTGLRVYPRDEAGSITTYAHFSYQGVSNYTMIGTASDKDSIVINTSGNVGIGTTSPAVKLDVYGSLNLRSEYNLTWGGTAGANIPLIYGKTGDGGHLAFHSQGTDGESLRLDASNNAIFAGNVSGSATSTGSFGTLALGGSKIQGSIFVGGTLGVGGGQSTAFHVTNTDPVFRLQNGGNYFDYAHTSGNDLELSYNGGSALVHLTNAGNLGIGTSSPSRALHVVGDALVTGILTAQEFHTEFVSASVMFESGSTKFGDDTADSHEFTGSVFITGSVGIGTTSPSSRLHVKGPDAEEYLIVESTDSGDGNATLQLTNDGGAWLFQNKGTQSDNLVFRRSGVGDFMVIETGGNVGIGTTSPESKLHIFTADASIAPNADADELVVENSANAGISILSGNTSNGAIYFGDAQDNNVGMIDYDHATNKISLTAGATTLPVFSVTSNTAEFGSTVLKVSGSATSTGSFGQLRSGPQIITNNVANNVGLLVDTNAETNAIQTDAKWGPEFSQTTSDGTGLTVVRNNNDTETYPLVRFTSEHATTTQPTLTIKQDGAGYGLEIDQNGDKAAIYIDTEATTQQGLFFNAPAQTSGDIIRIGDANSLTTGRILFIESNSSDSNSRELIRIINDHASATGTTPIYIQNDSTGGGIEFRGTGHAISGSATSTGSFGTLQIGEGNHPYRGLVGHNQPLIQVETNRAFGAGISVIQSNNDAYGALITLGKSRGTPGTNTTVQDGDVIGRIAFSAADGTDMRTNTSEIRSVVNGTVVANSVPSDLVLMSGTSGSADATERLRLTSDNKISGSATSTGSFGSLDINMAGLGNSNGDKFRITAGGGGQPAAFYSSNQEVKINFYTGDGSQAGNIDVYDAAGNVDTRLNGGGDSWFTGDLGIGETAPDGKLHIKGDSGAGSVTANSAADELIVEAQNPGISIIALDAGDASLIWGSASDNIGVQAKWNYNADVFRFRTSKSGAKMVFGGGDSENVLTVNSSSVGIGTESPDNTLHVHKGTAGSVAGNNSTTPLVVENSNHNFIQFLNPADKQAGLYFGSPSNNYYDGTIAYDKPNDQFTFEIDAASGNNKVIQLGTTYMSSSADLTGSFGQLVVGKGAPKTTGDENFLIVEGNISGSGRMIIADKGTSVAATIRATDTTNGYGLAVEGGGTGNTRYNVIFRSADASTNYGGIATKTGQVGYWAIGTSPTGTLENQLNVAGNASIGSAYPTVEAPTNGLLVQGSLGVGNPNVPKQLTVSGSGTQEILLESSDGHARLTLDGETSSDLVFQDDTAGSGGKFAQLRLSDELLRLRRLSDAGGLVTNPGFVFDLPNDRFGIGTESPEGQFHVSGSEKTLIECNASSETLGIINTNASPYGIQVKFEGAAIRDSSDVAYVLRAIDSTGDFLHIKSNGTYSGSATATGSFGAMHVAQNTYDRVGFGTQVLDQAKVMIKQTQDNGTALHMDVTDTSAAGSTIMARCIFSGDADATLAKFFSFNDSGAEIGSIEVSGTSNVAYNTSSDYRLKENIIIAKDGLKRLNLLKPRQFNFKTSDVTMDGFLAHELDEVLPYAVSGEKDALNEDGSIKAQQVDQSRIVPLLVRAVQELSAKVEELEKKLK